MLRRVTRSWRSFFLFVALVACFLGCSPAEELSTQSVQSAITVPSGYTLVRDWWGVWCYQKGPHYVCAVDLRYAQVKTVHGGVTGRSVTRKVLRDLWDGAPSGSGARKKVIAVNISFFDMRYNPTGLSFPYKQWDGTRSTLITKGGDCVAHLGYLRNLHLWWDRQYAAVGGMGCSSSDFATLESYGSAPDIIGGLDWTFPIDPSTAKERTFIGVHDSLGGMFNRETLLIFSSSSATQADARQELINFGANELMMFDGGGSTQLIIDGNSKISSTRPIPNALVVYAW